MVSCRWLVMIRVLLVVLAAVLIQGCGLKADPSPRRTQALGAVTDVRFYEERGGGGLYSPARYHAMKLQASSGPGNVSEHSKDSI